MHKNLYIIIKCRYIFKDFSFKNLKNIKYFGNLYNVSMY